jgi:hypothetical protein
MNWISENWLLLLFGGLMVGMHFFGHKGHGGCCGGGHRHKEDKKMTILATRKR